MSRLTSTWGSIHSSRKGWIQGSCFQGDCVWKGGSDPFFKLGHFHINKDPKKSFFQGKPADLWPGRSGNELEASAFQDDDWGTRHGTTALIVITYLTFLCATWGVEQSWTLWQLRLLSSSRKFWKLQHVFCSLPRNFYMQTRQPSVSFCQLACCC